MHHGSDCSITNERYITLNARSSRYENEIKNAINLEVEKSCKCMLCPKRYCKGTMVVNYWKKHREKFK